MEICIILNRKNFFTSAVKLHQILTGYDDENEIEEMYQQFLKKLDDMEGEEE